ncbi:hypothetical protein ACHAXN_007468 [Cyclotella atomus]|jgi:23S rRNA pseudouridine1911/1915/1917 synthase
MMSRRRSNGALSTCHAKLNKLASSIDLDEILLSEKEFTPVEEKTSKRKRVSNKDMKRQKLKEVLEKQKGVPNTADIDTTSANDQQEYKALLNSLEYDIHVVDQSEEGKRVDGMLVQLLNEDAGSDTSISRSQCGSLLGSGCVFAVSPENSSMLNRGDDTKLCYSMFEKAGDLIDKKSYPLESSSILVYPTRQSVLSSASLLSNVAPTEIIPQNLPLDIIYEDECMIVLNKEAGMVVHPAAGNWDGTVVNALSYYLMNKSPFGSGEFFGEKSISDASVHDNDSFGEMDEEDMDDDFSTNDGEINQNDAVTNSISTLRPGIVHRLDKGTTGVLVVAKTKSALASLSEAFAQRSVKKQYLAVAIGNPGEDVRINKPIGRHPQHRQKMRVVPDPSSSAQQRLTGPKSTPKQGRVALSYLRTLCHDGKLSLVQVQIATGRTHQIRVHLQDHGTPIYGDDVYGLNDWNKALSTSRGITRPLLHAQRLEIDHPITGERMVFEANVADDMMAVIRSILPEGTDLDSLLQASSLR